MKFNELLANLIKTGALTIMGDYAMKSLNKKDFGALIKVTGISSATIDILKFSDYIKNNPPGFIKFFIKIGEFIERGRVW